MNRLGPLVARAGASNLVALAGFVLAVVTVAEVFGREAGQGAAAVVVLSAAWQLARSGS